MRIVIETSNRDGYYLMIEITNTHKNKINSINRTRKEISLINGDVIKMISTDARYKDGIRADVAIGPNAELLTVASTQEKRKWEIGELYNYIKKI